MKSADGRHSKNLPSQSNQYLTGCLQQLVTQLQVLSLVCSQVAAQRTQRQPEVDRLRKEYLSLQKARTQADSVFDASILVELAEAARARHGWSSVVIGLTKSPSACEAILRCLDQLLIDLGGSLPSVIPANNGHGLKKLLTPAWIEISGLKADAEVEIQVVNDIRMGKITQRPVVVSHEQQLRASASAGIPPDAGQTKDKANEPVGISPGGPTATAASRRNRFEDVDRAATELYPKLWKCSNLAEWTREVAKRLKNPKVDRRTVERTGAWEKATRRRARCDQIMRGMRGVKTLSPQLLDALAGESPDWDDIMSRMSDGDRDQLKENPIIAQLYLEQRQDDQSNYQHPNR